MDCKQLRLIRAACRRQARVLKGTAEYLTKAVESGDRFDLLVALQRCIDKWIAYGTFIGAIMELVSEKGWWYGNDSWSELLRQTDDIVGLVQKEVIPNVKKQSRYLLHTNRWLHGELLNVAVESERAKILWQRIYEGRGGLSVCSARYTYKDEIPALLAGQTGVCAQDEDGNLIYNDEDNNLTGQEWALVQNSRLFRLYEELWDDLKEETPQAAFFMELQERLDANRIVVENLLERTLKHEPEPKSAAA